VNLSHLIASYGYWVLFLLVGAESLGVPLPGETALIIAGTYAGHTHRLDPWAIFAVASAAAIIGDNIGYWLGDQGGYRLARRYGPKVRLDERKLKTARYLFDRHGVLVVFFGRFVSVLRTYAAFLAGVSKMRWRVFLPANAAGGIVWAGVYTLASYLAGDALQRADTTINWILAAAAVVAFVAVVLVVRRQFGRLAERAEAAYPGPLDQPSQPGSRAGQHHGDVPSPTGQQRRDPGEAELGSAAERHLDGALVGAAEHGELDRAARPGRLQRVEQVVRVAHRPARGRHDQVALGQPRLGGRTVVFHPADEHAIGLRQADRAAQPPGYVTRRQRHAQPGRCG
jgi:membrane protein DedA with SNARE-associated domain